MLVGEYMFVHGDDTKPLTLYIFSIKTSSHDLGQWTSDTQTWRMIKDTPCDNFPPESGRVGAGGLSSADLIAQPQDLQSVSFSLLCFLFNGSLDEANATEGFLLYQT